MTASRKTDLLRKCLRLLPLIALVAGVWLHTRSGNMMLDTGAAERNAATGQTERIRFRRNGLGPSETVYVTRADARDFGLTGVIAIGLFAGTLGIAIAADLLLKKRAPA